MSKHAIRISSKTVLMREISIPVSAKLCAIARRNPGVQKFGAGQFSALDGDDLIKRFPLFSST